MDDAEGVGVGVCVFVCLKDARARFAEAELGGRFTRGGWKRGWLETTQGFRESKP